MTVNSTLITAQYTAHATDSFVTEAQADGSRKVIEDQRTKIIRIQAFRGAMTFYGLAQYGQWSTIDWLRARSGHASHFTCAEDFALNLANDLTTNLGAFAFSSPLDGLLGIHFTAYERVSDYWVPEFFHIRNWVNPPYSALDPAGFTVTRETYATLMNLVERPEAHREAGFRLEVHKALHSGVLFRFNNGDPVLFNPIANALIDTVQHLRARGHLREPLDARFHLALVRRPVELVSRLLADVASADSRRIGGKLHDLAIAPDGTPDSTTGD